MILKVVCLLLLQVSLTKTQMISTFATEPGQALLYYQLDVNDGGNDERHGKWIMKYNATFTLQDVKVGLGSCDCAFKSIGKLKVQIKRPRKATINCNSHNNITTETFDRDDVYYCIDRVGEADEFAEVTVSGIGRNNKKMEAIEFITFLFFKENRKHFSYHTTRTHFYPETRINRISTPYYEIPHSIVPFVSSSNHQQETYFFFLSRGVNIAKIELFLFQQPQIKIRQKEQFSVSLFETNQGDFTRNPRSLVSLDHTLKRIKFSITPRNRKSIQKLIFFGNIGYTNTIAIKGSRTLLKQDYIIAVQLTIIEKEKYAKVLLRVPNSSSGSLKHNPFNVIPTMDVTTFSDMWVIDLGKEFYIQKLTLTLKPSLRDTLFFYFSKNSDLSVEDSGRMSLRGNTHTLVDEFKLMSLLKVDGTSRSTEILFKGTVEFTRFVIIKFAQEHSTPVTSDITTINIAIVSQNSRVVKTTPVVVTPGEWDNHPPLPRQPVDFDNYNAQYVKLIYFGQKVHYITFESAGLFYQFSTNVKIYLSHTNNVENKTDLISCTVLETSPRMKFRIDKPTKEHLYVLILMPKTEIIPKVEMRIAPWSAQMRQIGPKISVQIENKPPVSLGLSVTQGNSGGEGSKKIIDSRTWTEEPSFYGDWGKNYDYGFNDK